MVLLLPKAPTFAEQFSQSLGRGVSEGVTNVPELAMRLAAQRRERQGQLASNAQELLEKFIPDATPMERGNIAAAAEKLRGSPGEVQQQLMNMLSQESQKVSRLKSIHDAPGLKSAFKSLIQEGRLPSVEESIQEAKAASKDLDKLAARKRLADKGFNAEMIEKSLSSLDPTVSQIVSKVPKKISKFKSFTEGKEVPSRSNEERKQQLSQNLKTVFSLDPNANLVLLRKEYEKRGIDWRDFKDVIQNLYNEGVIDFNEEQKSMLKDITRPPLDRLAKALRRMKLVKE